MSLKTIQPVEEYTFYLDHAFSKAKKRAEEFRNKNRKRHSPTLQNQSEQVRLDTVNSTLSSHFQKIVAEFPRPETLPLFYNELLNATVDTPALTAALKKLEGAQHIISRIHAAHIRTIHRARDAATIHATRSSFYGRVSSIVEGLEKDFKFLEKVRRIIRTYPIIKDFPTVAIAGFPNVGKTTLLSKITTSKPEIAEYAFTTKHINIGYMRHDSLQLQLLDTPGTLDRPDKMNSIEKQAYLAIKHLAHAIVYVFDPTEPYPLEKQEQLLTLIKKENKPILIYISKTDITPKEKTMTLKAKHPELITEPAQLEEQLFLVLRSKR